MRIFLIIVALCATLFGGLGWYLYAQTTYTPQWYEAAGSTPWPGRGPAGEKLLARLRDELQSTGSTRLRSTDVEHLITFMLLDRTGLRAADLIEGARTQIAESGVSLELVVDVAAFSGGAATAQMEGLLARIAELVPDQVYLKLELRPGSDRVLSPRDASMYLGKIQMSMEEARLRLEEGTERGDGMDELVEWFERHRFSVDGNDLVVSETIDG